MYIIDHKNHITITDVVNVCRRKHKVALSDTAKEAITKSRQFVEEILKTDKVVYGISTGFGEFAKVTIDGDKRATLQRNLILSHCTGVGDFLPEDVVRGVMLLRANSLARGYSGIRLSTVEKLIELLNVEITPAIPAKGSVGASGDLAPLSHMAAVLLGEGFVLENGKAIPTAEALKAKGITPIELAAKEGLALINGTQVMTSIGALAVYDTENLMKTADIAAALSLEALEGTLAAYDPRIASIRPHLGQIQSAENVRRLAAGSKIIEEHHDCEKVQDAYSLRCVSQVHGASREALRRVKETIDIEMNAVTDNPIVMADTGEIISGGNFHGQPVALVMDYLKLAISEIGNISERRINRLVDPHLSGLPAFLTEKGGVNSGMMIAQYTGAALASENKVLVHPASADSIPTSANQEDHVSMGTIGSRQAAEMLANVQKILAIELMCAAQGVDFLNPAKLAAGTAAAYKTIRTKVSTLGDDRLLCPDIWAIDTLVASGAIVDAVEAAIGVLN